MRYALLFLLCLCLRTKAATINAASPSFADVSAAVASAARGDTVTVPAGSATWTNTIYITKGITLTGAGRDVLTITYGSWFIDITPDATAIANEETIRVGGFTFNGSNVGGGGRYMIHVGGYSSTKTFKNLVIENNKFMNNGSGATAIFIQPLQARGVVHHNIFDRCDMIIRSFAADTLAEWGNDQFPFAFGNSDNLFFENNEIKWTSAYDGSAPGWIELGQGARMVVRYNSWNFANVTSGGFVTLPEVFDMHGFQNWSAGNQGQTGSMIAEFYGNTIANFGGNRWLAHRGSWGMYHNNLFTGSGTMAQKIQQYTSGCQNLVSLWGDTSGFSTIVTNSYGFNNTKNGAQMAWSEEFPGACGVAVNVHYWGHSSPFTGTTGIGTGTAAPTGSATAGVAYWQATTSTTTTNPVVLQAGVLYKALAANVWTPYYTPYTYPHPLVAGSNPPAPPPEPPTLTNSFYASEGVITWPFVTNANQTISQSILTTDPTLGGSAVFNFMVPATGSYSVVGYVSGISADANSIFINILSQPTTDNIWPFTLTGTNSYQPVTWGTNTVPQLWSLTNGVTNQLIIRGREAGASIGYISITIPPAAASSLVATAASISQINLTWTDNSTNETSFRVLRSLSADGPFAQISSVSSNVVAFSDTGLAASQTYHYRVRSNDTYDSNTANATTSQQAAAPSGVAGTPQLMMRRR